MKEFCPKCGSEEGEFIRGFCRKCYLEDHKLIEVPEALELEKCGKCGKVKISGRWVKPDGKNLAEFFGNKVKTRELSEPDVKIELSPKSGHEFEVKISATGMLSGEKVSDEKTALLRFRGRGCPDCGKLRAGYFEAKVQVRHEKERDENKEKKLYFELKCALAAQRAADAMAVITKREELQKGTDIFIGSNSAAGVALAQVKKKFKVKILTTKKLVGQSKSGKRRYQFTYRIRL